ncbi:adaptin N terminal region-domain-containing protein [Jimgerdemannia flammicorona]|uniref:Adaptin N terminal region-domain-containing protein n=1 Tax=Jimgerdemannia flammicorona TaxID=994334 RepID=A0A433DAH2_9FUNG|nr:adaptin N terminal region-domain-containing protein [Jimgerdemannia flammicorona]
MRFDNKVRRGGTAKIGDLKFDVTSTRVQSHVWQGHGHRHRQGHSGNKMPQHHKVKRPGSLPDKTLSKDPWKAITKDLIDKAIVEISEERLAPPEPKAKSKPLKDRDAKAKPAPKAREKKEPAESKSKKPSSSRDGSPPSSPAGGKRKESARKKKGPGDLSEGTSRADLDRLKPPVQKKAVASEDEGSDSNEKKSKEEAPKKEEVPKKEEEPAEVEDEEMSELEDEMPVRKRRRTKERDETAGSEEDLSELEDGEEGGKKKGKAGKGGEDEGKGEGKGDKSSVCAYSLVLFPAQQAAPVAVDKDEETIKRLKTYINKCGPAVFCPLVRFADRSKRTLGFTNAKRSKELGGIETVSAQIKHLKAMLEELGVEGRPTLEKCEKIKAARELRDEIDSLSAGNIVREEEKEERRARASRGMFNPVGGKKGRAVVKAKRVEAPMYPPEPRSTQAELDLSFLGDPRDCNVISKAGQTTVEIVAHVKAQPRHSHSHVTPPTATTEQRLRNMNVLSARPKFFTTNKRGENFELKADLNSEYRDRRKDAVKKVIANMTVGKDVSGLFPDVLKNMQTEDLELKKLVYLYLINYAKSQPELVILAVNTFVKDTDDPNPLIRALAIRTMGCLRVEKIIDYLCEPLRKCLKDDNPYVRKTAAICVAKLYEIAPDLAVDNGFVGVLQEMVSDINPMVVANAVIALSEIHEGSPNKDIFIINQSTLNKLLHALNECTE